MIVYLDTSAIVKLYAAESESAEVKRLFNDAQEIASSLLAYAETRSALARKHRMRQMSEKQLNTSRDEFEADWASFIKVSVDGYLIRVAGDLAERFSLKAYDAIHLASADQIQREVRSPTWFVCFDAALSRAASSLGLKLTSST